MKTLIFGNPFVQTAALNGLPAKVGNLIEILDHLSKVNIYVSEHIIGVIMTSPCVIVHKQDHCSECLAMSSIYQCSIAV